MEHNDYHFHWWHWLIIIATVLVGLGIAYTWIMNYDVVKKDNRSYINGIQQTVEHPIDTTQNVVKDIENK